MPLTIPTIFTAVDKFTAPLQQMSDHMTAFGSAAEGAIGRSERAFHRFLPVLGESARQLLEFASAAAIAGALVMAVHWGIDQLQKYNEAQIHLRETTGASGPALEEYNRRIMAIGVAHRANVIDTTDAFIATLKLNPALQGNAEAIYKIVDASTALSKATGGALIPLNVQLNEIYTKYNIGVDKAAGVTDALAMSMKLFGKGTIEERTKALADFSSTARTFGLSPNQSIALVSMTSGITDAAAAGGGLSLILRKLETARFLSPSILAQLGNAGINARMLSDSAVDIGVKFQALYKIKDNGALLDEIFGRRGAETIKALINVSGGYLDMLAKINDSQGAANEMEMQRRNIASVALNDLANTFSRLLISNNSASQGVQSFTSAINWLTDHLQIVLDIVVPLIEFFVGYEAIMFALSFATKAWSLATGFLTIAQEGLNAAMIANPIGLIIEAIAAVVLMVAIALQYWDRWGAAFMILLGPIGLIISFLQTLRRNWDMVVEAFQSKGILAGIEAIGKVLLDAVIYPVEQLMHIIGRLTHWDWANQAAADLNKFRVDMGVNTTTDDNGNPINKPAINSEATRHEMITSHLTQNKNSNATLTIANAPAGSTLSTDSGAVPVKSSSTMFWGEGWSI